MLQLHRDIIPRCLLISYKTKDELKQLYYFILHYYEPLLDQMQKFHLNKALSDRTFF